MPRTSRRHQLRQRAQGRRIASVIDQNLFEDFNGPRHKPALAQAGRQGQPSAQGLLGAQVREVVAQVVAPARPQRGAESGAVRRHAGGDGGRGARRVEPLDGPQVSEWNSEGRR